MQIYDFLAHYWFIGSLERGHGGHSGNTLQKLSGHQTYEVFKTS